MAPLYQRYIPGTLPAPVRNEPENKSVSTNGISHKRKHEQPLEKTSRKARKVREELAGNDDDVEALPTQDTTDIILLDEDASTDAPERSGEFAHIKSAKKRHKLEKEARKARKQAGREICAATTDTRELEAENPVHDTHSLLKITEPPLDQASSKDELPVRKAKKEKLMNTEDNAEVDDAEEDDVERLKKHASVLKKFNKAQKRAASAAKQEAQTELPQRIQPEEKTIVDPFTPIEVDMSMPDLQPDYSALPSWITSAKRMADTSAVSFDSLHLDASTVERLGKAGFTSALPVQQALLPLLLPPSIPGSQFAIGAESLLPDIAVSAPTGSGKTLAYLLPIVESLKVQRTASRRVRTLIVVPTRELVGQVASLAETLSHGSSLKIGTASGSGKLKDEQQHLIKTSLVYDPTAYRELFRLANLSNYPPDENSLDFDDCVKDMDQLSEVTRHKMTSIADWPVDYVQQHESAVDILICTPGRLIEHLENTSGFELSHTAWLVLDEADKLLDEQYDGFLERLHTELATSRSDAQQGRREKLLRSLDLWDENSERRVKKVVLSATMTRDVSQLAALRLQRPRLIIVGAQHNENATTEQNIKDGEQHFELPATLREYSVPVGGGSAKPLYLLQLLEQRVLDLDNDADSDDSSESSESDSGCSDDSNSDTDTDTDSSLSDASSSSSMTSTSTIPSNEEEPQTLSTHFITTAKVSSAPTVLVFTASTEAALRLTHLLKQLRLHLADQITCLTKSSVATNFAARLKPDQPCIIVATDRAGRGLDTISGRHITHVVQYDVPRSLVSYVHRVGRTARADRSGQAWTLYTNTEARWFTNEIMKASSIKRPAPVERVRFSVDDDDDEQASLYKEALAGMRDIVFSSRART